MTTGAAVSITCSEVQEEISRQYPEIRTFFSSGSMVDAILNMGMPAPIDVQVSSSNLKQSYGIAEDLARQIRQLPGVGEVYIPQDMNYPALRLDVDRVHAGELGLTPEGRGGQRHHRAEFQLDDRAQLLGGPENRERLLPDRAIFRERRAGHSQFHGPEEHSPARAQPEASPPRSTAW